MQLRVFVRSSNLDSVGAVTTAGFGVGRPRSCFFGATSTTGAGPATLGRLNGLKNGPFHTGRFPLGAISVNQKCFASVVQRRVPALIKTYISM